MNDPSSESFQKADVDKTKERAQEVYCRWPLDGRRWWDADLSEYALWLGGGLCRTFTATPWLLGPFRARQVFSHELPFRQRVVLAFVILTVAFPLGGLAIPLWILVRRSSWFSDKGQDGVHPSG